MVEYNIGNTVRLKQDARPVGTAEAGHFKQQIENKKYWGVPVEYFTVEYGKVYMDSQLASELRWKVDGVMPDMLNIAALPDQVEVEGKEILINPGFWCSNIRKEYIL